MICDQCETVAHCMKHGCVPKQPAPVQPAFTVGSLVTLNSISYPGLGQWFVQLWDGDEIAARVYGDSREIINRRIAALNTPPAPPAAQPAPVQEPVALKPEDVIVETYAIQQGGFMLKPASGVRLIHKPTGTVVQCDSERSQHRNRETAWRDLEKYLTKITPAAAPVPNAITGDDESPEYRSGWNECRETMLHMLAATPAAPVQPVASLFSEIQAEPVTLIHKWRVSELVKEYAAQPAPVQEQTDWEAVAADQAMTIAMMKAESAYQRGYMDGMAKQRPWIGLKDEEAEELRIEKEFDKWGISEGAFKYAVRDIEAELKERNQ